MSRPCRLCPPITLKQVAERLGLPWCQATRKRLLRMVRAKEKETGLTLLWAKTPGGRFYTTESALLSAFPNWVDRRDKTAILIREEVGDILDKQRLFEAKLRVVAKDLIARTRALGSRVRALELAYARVR